MHGDRPDRGQILVIFAGGLVLIIAIAALVIDLGFAFALRNQEQNAADPGAIAAARYIGSGGSTTAMRGAACFYARQNGFFPGASDNAGCVPANDPQGTTLTVNYPPGPSAGTYSGPMANRSAVPNHPWMGWRSTRCRSSRTYANAGEPGPPLRYL